MRLKKEQFAAQDKENKERVETKNEAETMVYTAEKTLKEMDDKLTADEKSAIQSASDRLKRNNG